MRSLDKRNLRAAPLPDDTLMLLCWLIALLGAFGVTGWLCYRLLEMPPFMLVPPAFSGS